MSAQTGSPGGASTFFLSLAQVFGDPIVIERFSEHAYIDSWLSVERALAKAQSDLGIIPRSAADSIVEHAVAEKIDAELLRSRTTTVGYPILPLLEQINAKSPREVSDFIHWGATTQ